jgi:hypothetical protein
MLSKKMMELFQLMPSELNTILVQPVSFHLLGMNTLEIQDYPLGVVTSVRPMLMLEKTGGLRLTFYRLMKSTRSSSKEDLTP